MAILRRTIKLERTRSVSVAFLLAAVGRLFFPALIPTKVSFSLNKMSSHIYWRMLLDRHGTP